MNTPLQAGGVAFFTECYLPIVNGVVASIDGLRAGLVQAGVDVTIVAPRFSRARDDDGAILRLPSLPLPAPTAYRLCVPIVSRRTRARIRAASVVHAHSPFVTGWLGASVARRQRIPLVFTYHTRLEEYAHYAPFEPRATRSAMTALTRTFANRADAVVVPTRAMERHLRDIGVLAPIAIVPSSIDVERFGAGRRTRAARALLGANDGERIVLAVARVAKEKRLELAIDALARARGFRLAIVGAGPERAALEGRAAALGVRERVRFTGQLDPAALPDLYASSDAFVFPSASETQGLVLAEAMAAGLPVVAVDGAVNREVLAGFGRLAAPDPGEFADALAAAVAAPRDRAAAEHARRSFSRRRQAAAMLELYRSISVCRTFGTPAGDNLLGSHA
jgi:glycosyltransferase involved in cell wall biosynthesis